MNAADYAAKYIKQDLPGKLISWLSYLFFPAIIAMLSSCHSMVSRLMSIPIYFWTLLWHTDGCSIFDMLCNPEGNSRLVRYDNNDTHPCWREQSQPVPWWAWCKCPCWIRICLSNHSETLPFKDMTQDFACSHITRYIQQVSTRLPVIHHLKMASLLKSLKPHILRAFNMVLVCLSVPNCFARHDPKHHIIDSYLCFWCFFLH